MLAIRRRSLGARARWVALALYLAVASPGFTCSTGSMEQEPDQDRSPAGEATGVQETEKMSPEDAYRAAFDGYRTLAEALREPRVDEDGRQAALALRRHLERLAELGEKPTDAAHTTKAPATVEPSGPVTPSSDPPTPAEIESMERATEQLRGVLPPRAEPTEPTLAGVPREWIARSSRNALDVLTRLEAQLGEVGDADVEAALSELHRALEAISRPQGDD